MRVALVSAIQSDIHSDASAGGDRTGSFALIAGRSVVERQLNLCLSIGCERIACITDGMTPEIIALQHIAEKAGATFHVVRRLSDLGALVTATDEVFALADSLFVEPDIAANWAEGGKFIAALPVEAALEAGFERIDSEWGWAGVLLAPGHLVERLADLPPDSDAVAALLRIALQSQVKIQPIDVQSIADKRLALVKGGEHATDLEAAWLKRKVSPAGLSRPTRALTDRIALKWGGGWLARGVSAIKLAAGAITIAAIAAAGAWFIGTVYGLLGAIFAAFLASQSVSIAALESGETGSFRRALFSCADWAVDLVIVLAIILMAGPALKHPALFAAIVMLGIIRLAKAFNLRSNLMILCDRIVLACIILFAALFSQGMMAAQLVALTMLGTIFFEVRRSRLTQV